MHFCFKLNNQYMINKLLFLLSADQLKDACMHYIKSHLRFFIKEEAYQDLPLSIKNDLESDHDASLNWMVYTWSRAGECVFARVV